MHTREKRVSWGGREESDLEANLSKITLRCHRGRYYMEYVYRRLVVCSDQQMELLSLYFDFNLLPYYRAGQ